MRFLVDAQLPRALAGFLKERGHDAIHTLDMPERNSTPDTEIRKVADDEQRIVVSKDDDFVTSHLLRGTPKKVLLVTTGNISNRELLQTLEMNLGLLEKAFDESFFVELTGTSIVVHA